MKIVVLEHPRIISKRRFNDIANTPLWSCLMGGYGAAALEREGFDTIFLDEAQPGASFALTKEKVLSNNPDILCVNAVYFWEHTPVLFEFLEGLRTSGYSGHINLFGFFPSLVYRQILKNCSYVDSVAVGEFECTIVDLARAISQGEELSLIEGLALDSCLLDTKSRMRTPQKNPDLFAFPQRSSLEGSVSILGSRGCYNQCSFCPVPSFYNQGKLWRGRSPQNIFVEIKALTESGASSFYFCDPNFIGPGRKGKERIIELMGLIQPLNIRFGMETRPQDLDDEILGKMVDSGFESLLMGIESGSSDVLKRIDKSSGPVISSRAIQLCRTHGIEPEIGFLMFVPDSSLADLKENILFLKDNQLLDKVDRTANLLSHTQIVLAGTSGYQRYEELDLLEKKGVFGFEADVIFSDPAVGWVADLLTFACHTVLRSMSDRTSPIFWENGDNLVSSRVNDYLVDLSHELIDQAGKKGARSGEDMLEHNKKQILTRIQSMVI